MILPTFLRHLLCFICVHLSYGLPTKRHVAFPSFNNAQTVERRKELITWLMANKDSDTTDFMKNVNTRWTDNSAHQSAVNRLLFPENTTNPILYSNETSLLIAFQLTGKQQPSNISSACLWIPVNLPKGHHHNSSPNNHRRGSGKPKGQRKHKNRRARRKSKDRRRRRKRRVTFYIIFQGSRRPVWRRTTYKKTISRNENVRIPLPISALKSSVEQGEKFFLIRIKCKGCGGKGRPYLFSSRVKSRSARNLREQSSLKASLSQPFLVIHDIIDGQSLFPPFMMRGRSE